MPADLGAAPRPARRARRRERRRRSRSTAPTCAAIPSSSQLLCASIARAGAPVSLGSDAHRPRRVGAVLGGIDLLRAAGVRERGRVRAPRAARHPALTAATPRSAFALLAFAMGVFVVSFPLMVDRAARLRPGDGDARAHARRRPPCSRVAARGQLRPAARLACGASRSSARSASGVQSWLLAYAMTHVGGALPALVLGLEPIVIGLVGSLVVREHVSGRLHVAFALGLAGEAVIAGFVTAGAGGAAAPAARARSPASSRCSRPTASRCGSSRRCRRRRSSASSSLGGAVAVLPIVAIELVRGDAVHGAARRPRSRRCCSPGFAAAGLGCAGLGGRALARARGRGRARALRRAARRRARVAHRPRRAALRAPRRGRGDRHRGDRARPLGPHGRRGDRAAPRLRLQCAATTSPRSAAR